jgi:hypothetical protein
MTNGTSPPDRKREVGRGADPDPHGGLSLESVRAQLEKLLASATFSRTERLRRFLRFTVEETIGGKGEELKEYQIGIQVFGRKDSYDTRLDPIVRVEAGRLRSKLKEFYSNEGRNDPVVIEFQPGSYVPVFHPRTAPRSMAQRIWPWFRGLRNAKTLALVTFVLLAAAGFYWAATSERENLSLRRQIEAAKQSTLDRELALIWGDFFTPDAKNFVVFGSPVFVTSDRETLFLRWVGLSEATSSPSDPRFQAMQKRFGPLMGPRNDYALMGDAVAVQRLTAFFGRARGSLTALPAHEAAWEVISDGNVIFLGAPRMIHLLARLPVRQDFVWDDQYNLVNRNPQPGEQAKYITPSHRTEMSYAVIAFCPGLRPNRRMLLLTAHSEPGIRAAVDYVTQAGYVRELVRRLGIGESTQRKYYQVLLRVIVDQGSQVKTEYVTHHLIPPA